MRAIFPLFFWLITWTFSGTPTEVRVSEHLFQVLVAQHYCAEVFEQRRNHFCVVKG